MPQVASAAQRPDGWQREGMRVVLADIDVGRCWPPPPTKCPQPDTTCVAVPTDVGRRQAIEALRDAALDAFGAVHVVHNNAGVVASGLVGEISLDLWKWVLDIDLWSVIHGVRTFAPLLTAQGEGHIVNTASTAGLQAMAGIGPYNVAKFGVVALSETLRAELDGTGVGVSVLCPGAVNTRIVDAERNLPTTSPRPQEPWPSGSSRGPVPRWPTRGWTRPTSRRWCWTASSKTGSGSSPTLRGTASWPTAGRGHGGRLAAPRLRRVAEPMERRQLGQLAVPAVGFGAMVLSPGLYGSIDDGQATRALSARDRRGLPFHRHVRFVRLATRTTSG